jgi:glycosyltransferase involved in cell wall biosynthesis
MKTSINILFNGSIDFNTPASVAAEICNTSKHISKEGVEFRIFCDGKPMEGGDSLPLAEEINDKVSIYRFPGRKLQKSRRAYKWGKIFWIAGMSALKDVSLNHIYCIPELELCSRLFSPQTPNIFHVQSFPGSWHGNRWLLAMKNSDLIIAVSKFIKRKLIEKYPITQRKVIVLPNGADTDMFHPKREFDIRGELGLRKSDFIVLFSGNLWEEKGFHIALKTAQNLHKRNEDIVFLAAGGLLPDKNPRHRKWMFQTPANMKYLGFLSHADLARYYASADVTIVPSLWEDPCPLVVFESLASGTPVIGSRIGGIPEFIDDGIDGYLITPGSVSELVNRILLCKRNARRLETMGEEARKKGVQFDWSIISDHLRKIYCKLNKKRMSNE